MKMTGAATAEHCEADKTCLDLSGFYSGWIFFLA
jgi:hypothetical protein